MIKLAEPNGMLGQSCAFFSFNKQVYHSVWLRNPDIQQYAMSVCFLLFWTVMRIIIGLLWDVFIEVLFIKNGKKRDRKWLWLMIGFKKDNIFKS